MIRQFDGTFVGMRVVVDVLTFLYTFTNMVVLIIVRLGAFVSPFVRMAMMPVVMAVSIMAMRSDILYTHVPNAIDGRFREPRQEFSISGALNRERIPVRHELFG